jgi:hypothetical protein
MARQVDRRHGRGEPPAVPQQAPAPAADQRAASNQALAAVLARKVGWEKAGKANAGEREVSGLRRLPIEGIAGGDFPSRAIVLLPAATAGSATVDVLLHLHGFTPGYAGAKPDDEGVYRIEAQLAASKRELIGILPQGGATADYTAGAGKAFDADNFIKAVFARLTADGAWDTEQGPAPGNVILSGHSGADQPIAEMLDSGEGASGKAPGKLAGLFLFDSMIASAFGGSVWNYVERRLKDELSHLRIMRFSNRPKEEVEAEAEAWLRENGFRLQVVYRKGGAYDAAARDIEGKLAQAFGAAKELAPHLLQTMKEHYAVHEITDTARIQHMDVLSGDDAFQKALETLPGGEPAPTSAQAGPARPEQEQPHFEASDGPVLARLASHAGNRAVSRLLARQPAPGTTDPPVAKTPETVKVKVRWDKTDPPQKYLKDAFTGHPVDWKAEVFVDGKSAGSGDGSLQVDMVKDSKHDIKVVPTPASKDLDYYETATATVKKAAAGDFDVRLNYNRENQYFTDESWEAVGIDPVKAGKVKSVDLLGKKVLVNELVVPTVDATNKHFNDKSKVTDEERKEITDSLVSIGGYNRRTTSSGSFSNHSTGCAIDINENLSTFQNMHFKKKNDEGKANTPHLQAMELIAKVVKRESGWSSWDPWAETDSDKWLEASDLFNHHFPKFLSELLDDALGGTANTELAEFGELLDWFGGTQAVGELMVAEQDPKKLRTAAKAATKAKKAETAKWLERVAGDWTQIRAWIEGVVMYKKGGWSYTSEHEGRVAAGKEKREVKGELHGLIPLHPKLVETLEAGGWTWLIDSTEAKDFMHFEDRKAFEAIKKKK